MEKEKEATLPFVKYYTGLSYLFTPAETRFILHMVDIEYKKSNGFNTNWSRSEYMKIMGLNQYSFDKTIKKLMRMKLLTRKYNRLGNHVSYSFNVSLYNKLIEILSATCNVNKLIEFCELNFNKLGREIRSIKKEEIEKLRSSDGLVKQHPSMFSEE